MSAMSDEQLTQKSPVSIALSAGCCDEPALQRSPHSSTSSGEITRSKRQRTTQVFCGPELVVEYALCVAGLAVTIVDIAGEKFVPFYITDTCKWLTNLFGYRWHAKLPANHALKQISAAISNQRGRATRKSRAVDATGAPVLFLEVDIPSLGVPLKVANVVWPVHITADAESLKMVIELLRKDLTVTGLQVPVTPSPSPATPTPTARATTRTPSPASASSCTATDLEAHDDASGGGSSSNQEDVASGPPAPRSFAIWQQVYDIVDTASLPQGIVYAASIPGFIVRKASFLGGKATRFRCQKPPQIHSEGDGEGDDGAYIAAVVSEVRRQRQRAMDFLKSGGRAGPSATATGGPGDADDAVKVSTLGSETSSD
jgi:hypothetical protein